MVSAGGLDDGLGSFRPSTSFNDFGALLKDEPSSTPSSPGGSVVADSPEAEAAKAAGSKCGKRVGTRAATRAADKACGATTTSAKTLGKTGGILSPSPAKGAAGTAGSAKKRSRPSTSPKAPGTAVDASAKKSKTVAGTAPGIAKATVAPVAKGKTVHPVSPTPAGKTTKPAAGAKGTAVTASGKVVTNPLTPGSKAAAAAAAKASASTAAASAAAAAKTVSTARRLITSTTSTTTSTVGVKAPAPAVTAANATAAAAAARAAAAKAAATSAQAKELTEHDFRGVAQAAVKNLMMSVGGSKSGSTTAAAPTTTPAAVPSSASARPTATTSAADKKPINTSSSHIAALTSSNWVQACSEGVGDADQAAALAAAAAANDPAHSKAARARRANLTPDERARQNRDRNREHARNTRLRKKAYVEELKKTLTELVAQRDAAELDRRHEAQRDLEVREVRFRVMEEFLKLRSQGDNPNLLTRWSAIMEDGFTLTIPRTDYRPIVAGQTTMRRAVSIDATSTSILKSESLEQILRGPNQVMEDASNLASFVNTFGDSTSNAGPVRFAYHCERKNFMMDGVNAILHWTASTAGAVAKGAPSEMVVKGMMKANFSPASNKLNSAELLFDTGCITSQARSLITTPTVVTTSQILSSALSVTDKTTSAHVDMVVNDADALLDSLQMPHVTSSGNMSTVVSTASMDGTNTPAISSCDEGEVSESAQSAPATRRSTRIH